uniref:G-protein coupled receptors family 1 profile domain-containing protein n=1 Tax=Plectus sambesii TaxID=2011161 RepID=A0A914V300_9BILA
MYGNGTTTWPTVVVTKSNRFEDIYPWTYKKQFFYISLGGFAALTNFLLTLVISRHAALRRRKEYLIIVGLSFADFIEGFATCLAGAYRLIAINKGWAFNLVPSLTCMALPSHVLWRWSDVATSFMLLTVSCDRLFAVSKPLVYYQRGQSYAIKTVIVVYAIAIGGSLFIWPHILANQNIKIPAMCISTAIISPIFYQLSKYTTALISALSVFVYILVVLILQRRTQALRRCTDSKTLRRQIKVQRKLTVTLGFSSFLTLLLDSVPRAVGMHLYMDETTRPTGKAEDSSETFSAAPYFFLMTKLNAMANVFIFTLRQPEIRHGMRYLLSWSQLPVDLNLWDVTSRMGSDPRINPRGTYRKYGIACRSTRPSMREAREMEPTTPRHQSIDISQNHSKRVVFFQGRARSITDAKEAVVDSGSSPTSIRDPFPVD